MSKRAIKDCYLKRTFRKNLPWSKNKNFLRSPYNTYYERIVVDKKTQGRWKDYPSRYVGLRGSKQPVHARAHAAGSSSRESRKLKIAWEWAPPIGRGGRSWTVSGSRDAAAARAAARWDVSNPVRLWDLRAGAAGVGGAGAGCAAMPVRHRELGDELAAAPEPKRCRHCDGTNDNTYYKRARFHNNAVLSRYSPDIGAKLFTQYKKELLILRKYK